MNCKKFCLISLFLLSQLSFAGNLKIITVTPKAFDEKLSPAEQRKKLVLELFKATHSLPSALNKGISSKLIFSDEKSDETSSIVSVSSGMKMNALMLHLMRLSRDSERYCLEIQAHDLPLNNQNQPISHTSFLRISGFENAHNFFFPNDENDSASFRGFIAQEAKNLTSQIGLYTDASSNISNFEENLNLVEEKNRLECLSKFSSSNPQTVETKKKRKIFSGAYLHRIADSLDELKKMVEFFQFDPQEKMLRNPNIILNIESNALDTALDIDIIVPFQAREEEEEKNMHRQLAELIKKEKFDAELITMEPTRSAFSLYSDSSDSKRSKR